MGINGDGGMAKGGVQNNIGGFTSHPRQSLQGFPLIRDFALVPLAKQAAGLKKMFGFAAKQVEAFQQGR
jgi:hypothetical protein